MAPSSLFFFRWSKMFLIAVLPTILLVGCSDQLETTHTYRTQVPVYMEVAAFRSQEVGVTVAKPLSSTGKIYVYGDYLLINEPQKGIHVIDNRNPASPKSLNFITIPGNVDLAVNSGILYADSYIDLLAFDISDPQRIALVERVEDVFSQLFVDSKHTFFVAYKDTVVTYTSSKPNQGWIEDKAFNNSAGGTGGPSYGQGGSMARFTLAKGHLYTVDHSSLRLFNVNTADKPKFVQDIPLGWGIETVFPFGNKLFVGSTTGMHIYDIDDPAHPQEMSVYRHITACDPVVVNEKYAFVTLRSGDFCQPGADLLDVIDIRDPYHPELLKSYPMKNPHGLALSEDNLYVCEGAHGLRSFKVADVMNIGANQMEYLKEKKATDVIPGPKSLIVIGPDGVCQYDYRSPDRLRLLSCIAVND